jgi:hypothetical protein
MTYLVSLLFFLCSCFSRSTVMTRQTYSDIEVGSSITQVEQKVGNPYKIRPLQDGTEEYEYIERIPMGQEVVEENHYFLIVKDGKVFAKRNTQETPDAFDLIYDDDPNDIDLQ